jgi:hypothetical protein
VQYVLEEHNAICGMVGRYKEHTIVVTSGRRDVKFEWQPTCKIMPDGYLKRLEIGMPKTFTYAWCDSCKKIEVFYEVEGQGEEAPHQFDYMICVVCRSSLRRTLDTDSEGMQ